MSDVVTDLDAIDEISKHTVYGYVRQIQIHFPSHITYYNIPSAIINLVWLYFYESEYFAVFDENELKYDRQSNILSHITTGRSVSYGNVLITNSIPILYMFGN